MHRLLTLALIRGGQRLGQDLPTRWDELTASDWPKALEQSHHTAILPIGVLEKHGPHAPIGSDLIHAREWAARVAKMEYAVIFPDYFYGQIYEARHQPGTFALPSPLIWDLLDSTCEEIARNGFKKILIINAHGGNPNFLRFFVQSQLERPGTTSSISTIRRRPIRRPPSRSRSCESRILPAIRTPANARRRRCMYLRPGSGPPRSREEASRVRTSERLSIPEVYTAIWWYASYPNHYAGDGSVATRELGQVLTEQRAGVDRESAEGGEERHCGARLTAAVLRARSEVTLWPD